MASPEHPASHVHDWIDTEGPNRICRCGHIEPIPAGTFALGRSAADVDRDIRSLEELPLYGKDERAFDRTVRPNAPDHFAHPFAEDIDGVWHVRRDDFWDNDAGAAMRAHAACGEDIWSGHVSAFPPIMGDKKARHCGGCFPRGRRTPRGR